MLDKNYSLKKVQVLSSTTTQMVLGDSEHTIQAPPLLKQNNDTLTQESAPDTLITDKTHFGVKDVVLVKAYPNPVADEMIVENLSWRDSQTATVRIYDMTGKLVQSKSFSKARETFSLISLANGSYQVLYYVDGKQLTNWKIIKQ